MKHEAIYIVTYNSKSQGRRTYAFTPFDDSMRQSVKQALELPDVDPDSIEIEVYEPARILRARDIFNVDQQGHVG